MQDDNILQTRKIAVVGKTAYVHSKPDRNVEVFIEKTLKQEMDYADKVNVSC